MNPRNILQEVEDAKAAVRADHALDVDETGFAVYTCLAGQGRPPRTYSIGLSRTFRHPEVVVAGLRHDLALAVVARASGLVASGERLVPGESPGPASQGRTRTPWN